MANNDELKVQYMLTSPARISWPQVIEPRAVTVGGQTKGEPFYSARFVFPSDHPDLAPIKLAAFRILKLLKPDGDFKVLRPFEDFWYPLKSGDKLIAEARARAEKNGKEYRGFEDWMASTTTLFAKAYAKYPPQLDAVINGRWVKLNAENRNLHKDKFFNGMDAVGAVTIAGAKLPTGGWGVSCYLNGLGAIGGERIGGGQEISYSNAHIPTVTGTATNVNPMDDEDFVA